MINENIVLFTVNLDLWLVKLIEIVNLKRIKNSVNIFTQHLILHDKIFIKLRVTQIAREIIVI